MNTEHTETSVATVALARHGETAFNADGRLRGLADPELNEVGEIQAQALGADLARRKLGHHAIVVSSPLQRARRTAAVMAAGFGVEVRVDEAFNDRDYGPWTGRQKNEVLAEYGSVDAAPGVEPVDSVVARARPTLERWTDHAAAQGSSLVVVTHDAVIRPLLADLGLTNEALIAPPGSYQLLHRARSRWNADLFDQIPTLNS
ncbi:histidine phosphatase family protein [Gordonia sp. CPCC 205515]|uniref:histidine phosphatase family protein n=1 Tax=Gordonia sp. CPCC 205515 TaxID=3140791 RepID=UPI003AF35383